MVSYKALILAGTGVALVLCGAGAFASSAPSPDSASAATAASVPQVAPPVTPPVSAPVSPPVSPPVGGDGAVTAGAGGAAPDGAKTGSEPAKIEAPGLGYTAAANSGTGVVAPEVKILRGIEKDIREKYKNTVIEPSGIPSLVFTPSQHALLREARIGFNTRLPTMQELKNVADPNDPNYRPPAALREIALGGIVFSSPDDWTIWLNHQRVTPEAIPAEAVDLRVYKEFIELRWFDAATNQIYPIRLRTNQKFNIDARMFLPG